MANRTTRFGGKRRREGAIYAEAVITLPVFILLWALILFVNDGFKNALASATSTRAGGFTHTMAYCDGDVPSPTAMEEVGGFSLSSLPAVGAIMLNVVTGGYVILRRQPVIPIVYRNEFMFQITTNQYSQSGTVDRPTQIGGSARYGHKIALTCNENVDTVSNWEMAGYITAAYGASWSDLH